MSTPVIYEWLFSPSAEKVRRSLHFKGVKYESVAVDFFNRGNLVEASGQPLIPIVKHDGQTLGPATLPILKYIDKTFAGPTLFPNDSVGLCSIIDAFGENVLLGLGVRAFIPFAMPMLLDTPEKRAGFEQVMISRGFCKSSVDELVEEQNSGFPNLKQAYLPHFTHLDQHFSTRRYFLGDTLSAADHILYSHYWYANCNPAWAKANESLGLRHLQAWAARQADFYSTPLPF